MNIKEHIEAGHYPKDDKGRALVPMVDGRVVTILATDGTGTSAIVGRSPAGNIIQWSERGLDDDPCRLLPPRPRKVTKYAAVPRHALQDAHWYESDGPARREVATAPKPAEFALLTMEYEEPWT